MRRARAPARRPPRPERRGRAQGSTPPPLASPERLGTRGAPLLQSRCPFLVPDVAVAGSPRELQIEACWEHSPAPPRKCPLSSPTGSPSEESAGQPASLRASQRPLQLPPPQPKGSRAAGLGPGARCPRSWLPRCCAGRSVPAAGLPRPSSGDGEDLDPIRQLRGWVCSQSGWRTSWVKLCLGDWTAVGSRRAQRVLSWPPSPG